MLTATKLITIGEALIDFIANDRCTSLRNVESFSPKVGGAPLNVAGAFAKLGGSAAIITQLGADSFGDKIVEEAEAFNIGTEYIFRTAEYATSLAFVSLDKSGNREFSFFRKNAADTMLAGSRIRSEWFDDAFCLHFCSVSLGDFPTRGAHDMAIEFAKKSQSIISFDPNLRLPLWSDLALLKARVLEYMHYADIVKISDDELAFIFGTTEINAVINKVFDRGVKLILLSKGAQGAAAYTKKCSVSVAASKVAAVDTTGAGDAFIGGFLFSLYRANVDKEHISGLSQVQLAEHLNFAVKVSGYSVKNYGAIASYPFLQDLEN